MTDEMIKGEQMSLTEDIDNTIYSASPIPSPSTFYSKPIYLGAKQFISLSMALNRGTLLTITFYIQIFDGNAWADLYHKDTSTQWALPLSANFTGALNVVQDITKYGLQEVLWQKARIKMVTTGSNAGTSLVLRASAK